ncbi:uncharacterized protein EV422DRAFT_539059 [Fimicolochytrium jonesii]|uniref:uncharacterized protein n=1 Tax=Fimicolochytrium jonesii TaxID=1396493 RepID=UPI0022FEBAF8|nr:uncharacterized protein EV422DRAFT_539059 [Fimicolochytrium jonesii]KAI8818209.1 hypothetical protein EV422DRAFT_539059 [Fimicolochytrium jonesii]
MFGVLGTVSAFGEDNSCNVCPFCVRVCAAAVVVVVVVVAAGFPCDFPDGAGGAGLPGADAIFTNAGYNGPRSNNPSPAPALLAAPGAVVVRYDKGAGINSCDVAGCKCVFATPALPAISPPAPSGAINGGKLVTCCAKNSRPALISASRSSTAVVASHGLRRMCLAGSVGSGIGRVKAGSFSLFFFEAVLPEGLVFAGGVGLAGPLMISRTMGCLVESSSTGSERDWREFHSASMAREMDSGWSPAGWGGEVLEALLRFSWSLSSLLAVDCREAAISAAGERGGASGSIDLVFACSIPPFVPDLKTLDALRRA